MSKKTWNAELYSAVRSTKVFGLVQDLWHTNTPSTTRRSIFFHFITSKADGRDRDIEESRDFVWQGWLLTAAPGDRGKVPQKRRTVVCGVICKVYSAYYTGETVR